MSSVVRTEINDTNNSASTASVCINIHTTLKSPQKLWSVMSRCFTTPRKKKKKALWAPLHVLSSLVCTQGPAGCSQDIIPFLLGGQSRIVQNLVLWFLVMCRNTTNKKQKSNDNVSPAKDCIYFRCDWAALNKRSEIIDEGWCIQMIQPCKKLSILRRNSVKNKLGEGAILGDHWPNGQSARRHRSADI